MKVHHSIQKSIQILQEQTEIRRHNADPRPDYHYLDN